MRRDFSIIFDRIGDTGFNPSELSLAESFSREEFAELDELSELRRIVAEIAEPEPLSFTTA